MNKLIFTRVILSLILFLIAFGQGEPKTLIGYGEPIRIGTWNIQNFGRTKGPYQIEVMANVVSGLDVIAIQEIVGGEAGPKAFKRLLKKLGSGNWSGRYSNKTVGAGVERYGFIWRKSKLKLVHASLLDKFEKLFDREPFVAHFITKSNAKFTFVNFHAVPTKKKPAKEVNKLSLIHRHLIRRNVIIAGDFNLPITSNAYNAILSEGYLNCLPKGVKTSLRRKPVNRDYYKSEYDNILFETNAFNIKRNCQRHDLVKSLNSLTKARKISDHVPVVGKFYLSE